MAAVANLEALRARHAREARYSRFNGIKIHNQWRKIMRMTAVDALRGQIEVHAQSHERAVDRRDAVIQMLDRDLEDAEEQHAAAVRGHLAVVARLLDLQYQKVRARQEAFERDAAALAAEFGGERADIAAAHARHRRDLGEIVAAMQLAYGDLESDLRQARPRSPSAPLPLAPSAGSAPLLFATLRVVHSSAAATCRPRPLLHACALHAPRHRGVSGALACGACPRLRHVTRGAPGAQEFEAQREEIKNKNSEDYNVMKITLQSNIGALERKFELSHEVYMTQTADHSATFRELSAKDAQAARVIDLRLHKLLRLQVRRRRGACGATALGPAAARGARRVSRGKAEGPVTTVPGALHAPARFASAPPPAGSGCVRRRRPAAVQRAGSRHAGAPAVRRTKREPRRSSAGLSRALARQGAEQREGVGGAQQGARRGEGDHGPPLPAAEGRDGRVPCEHGGAPEAAVAAGGGGHGRARGAPRQGGGHPEARRALPQARDGAGALRGGNKKNAVPPERAARSRLRLL